MIQKITVTHNNQKTPYKKTSINSYDLLLKIFYLPTHTKLSVPPSQI